MNVRLPAIVYYTRERLQCTRRLRTRASATMARNYLYFVYMYLFCFKVLLCDLELRLLVPPLAPASSQSRSHGSPRQPRGRPDSVTVSFHNFKSQSFKLSVSNPKSKYFAYLSVLSQIPNCQSLGRKNKHEIFKTDRRTEIAAFVLRNAGTRESWKLVGRHRKATLTVA